MPDRDVRTIRDLIHYQHAEIIARSGFCPGRCPGDVGGARDLTVLDIDFVIH